MNKITDPEEFNKRYPIGTLVIYHPRRDSNEGTISGRTRSEAWGLGDGTSVVMIEGKAGGVALSHLEIADEEVLGVKTESVVREDQPPTLIAEIVKPYTHRYLPMHQQLFEIVAASAGPKCRCIQDAFTPNRIIFDFATGEKYAVDLAALLPTIYERRRQDAEEKKGKKKR